jgi:four helix bundle protein
MGIKTFRDLKIWVKGMEIVKKTYRITNKFPKFEEYALASQMRRAAISIPSNIAEGFGRKSKKEFHQFLHISLGSLFELETQVEIAFEQKYLEKINFRKFYDVLREMERMLCSFIASNQSLIN